MLSNNKAIVVPLLAWFLAQLIKVIVASIKDKKLRLGKIFESGGMPSSHTSLVVSLTTILAEIEGVNSSIFAVSLVFSLIVMYDAAGVRRAAGKQARALNKLIEEFYKEKPHVEERLKELIGHTPVEVFGGAILGIIVAIIFWSL